MVRSFLITHTNLQRIKYLTDIIKNVALALTCILFIEFMGFCYEMMAFSLSDYSDLQETTYEERI